MKRALFISIGLFGALTCRPALAADLLSGSTITKIDSQLNTSSWAAANLTDGNSSTRWLANKQANDINFIFNPSKSAACFDNINLTNYGTDDRSVNRFMLLSTMDGNLDTDTGTNDWQPIIADAAPSGLIDHLSWAQGGRITSIDSQLNGTSWAAEHLNDGDLRSRWLSNKANNTIEFAFDTNWDGSNGDAINIKELKVHNYGADDRSVKFFQVAVTSDGLSWQKLEVPGSVAGEPDFNFTLLQNGASFSAINSQLNSTSWAAENIHDGDNNSRWLSNKGNNNLDFVFDVDGDGSTSFAGDTDDLFTIEKIYLRNYGTDDRSIQDFQVEVKTSSNPNWTKLEVPGSTAGEADFNFLLQAHGGGLTNIDGQLNSSSWAAANIHDGDNNSRWLNNKGNNTLDFSVDTDGDGTTGANGDSDDLFTIEKIYLRNYGTDDRSVKEFQVEVKTISNPNWTKLKVPGSTAGQPNYNFAYAAHGGHLDFIDSQLNTSSWAAKNLHDGDQNSRWLSNKQNNTLAFDFDANLDGSTGDAINLDTIKLINYGSDDRSIQTFEIDIQISGGAWQPVNAPGGGTTFTAVMNGNGETWAVGPFTNVTAARIRTLTNHGDPSYTGAREIGFIGNSVTPSYTFTAAMNSNGETFVLDTADRPSGVTDVRFRTINNHGDPSYVGAREFNVQGLSTSVSHTFTAAMHGNGETFALDVSDRPTNVTAVRLVTINNHGDPSYIGAREFSVLGPSISPSTIFSLPMSTGPHTITLDNDDQATNVIGARLITIQNHGDGSYTGLTEFELRGDPVGPSYIFEASMDNTVQNFTFPATQGRVFRFHSLSNHGDGSYTGMAELELHSSNQCLIAEWRLDEISWSGAAGEVLDSSGNNHHGTAVNGVAKDVSDPAIAGNPGTCSYGDFDGSNDYIELPSSVPNLTNSFTISAWIYARELGHDQRIFVDDENNSGGFAFSLGDGGNGKLRFFSRSVSPVVIDTQSAVISQNNWHFVAAVHDANAKTRQIYVDGVAVSLNTGGTSSTYTGTWGSDAGNASIGGETNNAGGEAVANWRFNGFIDEVKIHRFALGATDLTQIMSQTHPCSTVTTDHLSMSHSGAAVTCSPEAITLTAHQADHSTDTGYTNTVNLSTSTNHGDWSVISGNGSLNNGTANDGAASYTFVAADNGSVQLGLKNTIIETLNINASDGSISENSGAATTAEDQNLTFNETGFRFLANNTPNAIGVQISAKDSDTGPGSQTLELQAIKTSPETGACEAALVNNNNIDLAFECLDPSACSSNRVAINGTNIGANNNGSVSTYVPVTLDFGDATDTTATFKLNYPDAGQIRLHARYNIPLADNSPSGNFMTGSSNLFVVKPAGLCVEVTDAASDCLSGDHTCSKFKAAGETFNLRISAVGWESSGESHSDFCAGNNTTPNFQLNNISLASNLVAPSPGTNATLNVTGFNMAASDNGIHDEANQTISEVGVFTISATAPSYLGETIATSNSANIGRFYPDHLTVSGGAITEACSSGNFSYLGQAFTANYTVTARNAAGAITANYRASFIRLDNSLNTPGDPNSLSFGAIDSALPTLLSSRLSHNGTSFTWNNDGTGNLVSDLTLARLGTGSTNIDGPFTANIGVLPKDADDVTVRLADRNLNSNNAGPNDNVLIGSSDQRYGRIIIDNAFGPETLNLVVPLRAEYWYSDGTKSFFTTNINHSLSCPESLYTTDDFKIDDADPDDSLTSADLASVTYQPLVAGAGSLTLGAPNKAGPLKVTLEKTPNWLRFDFDGNGSDDLPSAQALFGQYRGNDRIIYWREDFN